MNRNVDLGIGFSWGKDAADRILQNVSNILNTNWGEVAFDRTLGLNPDFFDKPINEMRSLLFTAITDAIQEREPRAVLRDIIVVDATEKSDIQIKVVIDRA